MSAGFGCVGGISGAIVRLTVLSVSYPLARVSLSTAGGAEQVLTTLDKALVVADHKSLVLAPAGSRCDGLLIPAQIPNGLLDENAKFNARRTFKLLLDRTLRSYPVDVVHMHGLDFHEYLPDHDIPIVVSLHLPLSWYQNDALRLLRSNLRLVCVSKSQADTAPCRVRIGSIIPNGIDLARFRPAHGKSNYAVAMGRICPEKGLHLAIDAAEQAGINLLIAGTVFDYPEHREYFNSMIRPRLNARIRFVGPVGGLRKANLLAGARCLLIPSLVTETSSLVAMESLASGTPVVAFPNGALPEIITPGRTGFLTNSAEEMAEAIRGVDSLSPTECRREAERRFSSQKMVGQYLNLYREALNRPDLLELQAA